MMPMIIERAPEMIPLMIVQAPCTIWDRVGQIVGQIATRMPRTVVISLTVLRQIPVMITLIVSQAAAKVALLDMAQSRIRLNSPTTKSTTADTAGPNVAESQEAAVPRAE